MWMRQKSLLALEHTNELRKPDTVHNKQRIKGMACMEKLVYLLWKPADAGTGWHDGLRTSLVSPLHSAGASRIRFCLDDDAVSAGAGMRLATSDLPLPDAVLSFWLDSACRRQAVEVLLSPWTDRMTGYLVCESEPIPNSLHTAADGERTEGVNHLVFLQIPPRLGREEWLALWQDQHTQVAIDTQQTFGYRQNLVTRKLSADGPDIDAIVEENFPPAAISDQNAFYRQESQEMLAANQKRMYQSCKRFVDFDRMARLPTSEYNYKYL